jgi:hypothetical protein
MNGIPLRPPAARSGFVLAALLFLLAPPNVQAGLPSALRTAAYDWVCVTDASLVAAYAPLAAHRQQQGLATVVISLEEALRWSPADNDTVATLRWLAGVAYDQWGARYLLLGGSHALLPSPLHHVYAIDRDYYHPTDAYYACLEGDWDVDGDGLFAEWEDDAADPTIHLAVGRIPADETESVAATVAKILAFEQRVPRPDRGALFVSSLMQPYWQPGDPYPTWALGIAAGLRDSAQARDPNLRTSTLFQGPEDVPPQENSLNPVSLVDSLGTNPHDFVHIQLQGINTTWELVSHLTVTATAFDPLANADHAFLLTMLSGWVGDTREPGVLQHLLTMPGGGAVAAIAPTGLTYVSPMRQIQTEIWARLVDPRSGRLGDVYTDALTAYVEATGLSIFVYASVYWYHALFGDPATLVRPLAEMAVHTPPTVRALNLRAVPNPFNPITKIIFEIPGPEGRRQPAQVKVFDLQGRRVATLLERALTPGTHTVTWRAATASGLYFARVTVAGYTATIKLTLVE